MGAAFAAPRLSYCRLSGCNPDGLLGSALGSRLVGSLLAIAAGSRQVGRYAPRGTLSTAGEKPLRGDRADQRRTDPISAKPVPHQSLVRCPLAVQ